MKGQKHTPEQIIASTPEDDVSPAERGHEDESVGNR